MPYVTEAQLSEWERTYRRHAVLFLAFVYVEISLSWLVPFIGWPLALAALVPLAFAANDVAHLRTIRAIRSAGRTAVRGGVMPDDEKLIRLLLRHIGDCLDETSLPGLESGSFVEMSDDGIIHLALEDGDRYFRVVLERTWRRLGEA